MGFVIDNHTSKRFALLLSDSLKINSHKQAKYTEYEIKKRKTSKQNDGKITKLTRFVWRPRRLKHTDNHN